MQSVRNGGHTMRIKKLIFTLSFLIFFTTMTTNALANTTSLENIEVEASSNEEVVVKSEVDFHKLIPNVENKQKENLSDTFFNEDTTTDEVSQKQETKTLTMKATAYTASCEGCSGTTYTGIDLISNPNQKVIAVDPNVIPLGTKVHVEGYGTAIAGDIGSAIKGNRIDVFIPSESKADQWGVQTVEVTILS